MRRGFSLLTVASAVVGLMVLPTVDLRAEPAPVPAKTHAVALHGVDRTDGRPVPAPGTRPAVLTGRRTVPAYSVLGVTWLGAPGESIDIQVRTRQVGGKWSDWTALHDEDEDRPDGPVLRNKKVRGGTAPLYAGTSDGVQVAVATANGARPRDLRLDLIDPGASEHDAVVGSDPAGAAHGLAARPEIHDRIEWGADESIMTWDPEYAPALQAGFVHHTAETNEYTAAEVPGIIRGIYAYHAKTKGWGDIGYNSLVDRFGRVFQGRNGLQYRPVIGGHVYGYNTGSVGVAGLGTFSDVAPTSEMVSAIADVLAWKLDLAGLDPYGRTTLNDKALDVVSGHRDAAATECPGELLVAKLPAIRNRIAALVAADEHVFTGDWDGDGDDTAGKFDDGHWVLRNINSSSASEMRFRFGAAGAARWSATGTATARPMSACSGRATGT